MLYGLRDVESGRLFLIAEGDDGLPEVLDAWEHGDCQLVARDGLREPWHGVGRTELRLLHARAKRERQARQQRLTANLE